MRWLQKLVRNGNSTQVTIPRPMLGHLGWLAGQDVIVELQEQGFVVIRQPAADEFAPKGRRAILIDVPMVTPR